MTSEGHDEVGCDPGEPQTIDIEVSTSLTAPNSKLINDPNPEDGMVSQHINGMRCQTILMRISNKYFNFRTLIQRLMVEM